MDLRVGDRVQVIRNINVSFILPEEIKMNYVLLPDEIYTVNRIDDFEMIINLNEGINPMGADVDYDDRDKLIKID